jgi:hypothetical protein
MLNDEEKQEMKQDGLSLERRENFAKGRSVNQIKEQALDDFIQHLDSMQKVFGPFAVSQKPTETRLNKL